MSGLAVGGNPLLKIIIGVILLGGIGVYLSKNKTDTDSQAAINSENGKGKTVVVQRSDTRLGGEGDTPQATVQTLSKQVGDLSAAVTQLKDGNDKAPTPMPTAEQKPNKDVVDLKEKVSELEQLVKDLSSHHSNSSQVMPEPQPQTGIQQQPQPQPQPINNGESVNPAATNEFGLSSEEQPATGSFTLPDAPSLVNPEKSSKSSIQSGEIIQDGDVEWIQPSDAKKVTNEQGKQVVQLPAFNGAGEVNSTTSASQKGDPHLQSDSSNKNVEDKSSLVPIYTVAENSTLMGSVGATALIGRVPLNNQLTDPFPFKVVIGKKNLASNGIHIPHLEGMVASGYAKGDYTLKCVTGTINSITYTFSDGTIRTVSGKEDKDSANSGGLGYLADYQGIPCISGLYISNIGEYLAQTTGINAVAGFAEAFSQGQAQTTKNTDGSSTSIINGTGSNMKFAAGKGIGKGVQSGADVLAQRQQGAYDAIYVAPGARVELHITKEVDIDYDKKGRKVSHVMQPSRFSSARGLD
jgi:integrating conjugative element protein (TIGR03752 family)